MVCRRNVHSDEAAASGPGGTMPALTGVRAIACIWVVLCHAGLGFGPDRPAWMSTYLVPGFLGVDLFFILSGFILSTVHIDMSLDMREIGRFYLKRIFRVYPLEICMMLCLAANAWRLNKIGNGGWYDLHTFLPVVLMIQPYYEHPPIIGWLSTNWSVGIELSCYLTFPILLVALRGRGRLPTLMALVVFLLLEAMCQVVYLENYFGRGAVLRGFSGFGLGASVAFAIREGPRFGVRTTTMFGIGCSLAIFGLLMEQCLWPIPLCMAGLIASLSCGSGPIKRFCEIGVVVWLGEISYSIYLVHSVFMGEWGWWWVGKLRWNLPGPAASAAWIAVTLLISVLVSAATYYGIEQPCRRLGNVTLTWLSRRSLAQEEPSQQIV
jgi:peptidoglycan/LPS O-acetylase OafA/YrhL